MGFFNVHLLCHTPPLASQVWVSFGPAIKSRLSTNAAATAWVFPLLQARRNDDVVLRQADGERGTICQICQRVSKIGQVFTAARRGKTKDKLHGIVS